MFPSEKLYAKHPIPVDESKPQQDTFPTPVNSNPDDSALRATAKISTGGLPQTLSLPQVETASDVVAPSASNARVAEIGWQARTDEIKSSAEGAGDSASHPYIFDLSGLQVAALVFLFAVIGLIIGIAATKASLDVLASLRRGPFAMQPRLQSQSPHTQSLSGPPSDSASSVAPTETSSAQANRSSVDVDSSARANTVSGTRPLEETAKKGTRDSKPSVAVPSKDSDSSTTVEPEPTADPEERPNRNDLTGLIARSAPPPVSAKHAHSAVAVGSIYGAPRNRTLLTTKPTTAAALKSSPPAASLKYAYPAVAVGPTRNASGNRALLTAKRATGTTPKPSPPAATSKRPNSAVADSRRNTAPGNPASHTAKPAAAEVPKPSVVGTKHDHPAVAGGPRNTAAGNPASHTAKPAAGEAPKSSAVGTKHDHPAVAERPKGAAPVNPTRPTARPAVPAAPNPPAPVNSEPAHPAVAGGPKDAAPRKPVPPAAKPAAPAAPNPPAPANSEPAHPAVAGGPKDAAPRKPVPPVAKPAAPAAPNPPAPVNSEPAHPAVAGGPKDAAPGNPAPLTAKPPTSVEPNRAVPGYNVTVPSKGSKPVEVVFPQQEIAFSSSLAITTQLSIFVPPESGPAAAQSPQLQAGKLVFYVLPRNPRPGDRYGAEETVKVRATIGQQGLVTEIRPVSGPIFLLSSTISAVRLWRYKPTLLNGTPIETNQDVTITFKLAR